MSDFFAYPQTPHLAWLGPNKPRSDKVLNEDDANRLLGDEVIVEEKLDGANLGISIDPYGTVKYQNRGQYLTPPFSGQFARLNGWASEYDRNLANVLGPNLILFGEWLAARHSIKYDRLPGWFIAFDVYDASEKKFWSTKRRDIFSARLSIPVAPCLLFGLTTLAELKKMVSSSHSRFGDSAIEGLVVRDDDIMFNRTRAKLVRRDFTQDIGEHWRRRTFDWNRVVSN